MDWSAIDEASRRVQPRVPLVVDGARVGSVACAHLAALAPFAPELSVEPGQVRLCTAEARRDAALAAINTELRAQGLIRAWRDETYPLFDPATMRLLARLERASSRFWGTLTFGAHCTGWVAGAPGEAPRLWIAQRSFDKATDPGAFDNLVGGGVPYGQSAFETLVREGWEEAGLPDAVMRRAVPGRVIRLLRDIPEGLQFEWIYAFDLQLRRDEVPVNQDGEVHAFSLLDSAEAVAMAAGRDMTVDAALVTLDFALRHRLLAAAQHEQLTHRAAGLWVDAPA